MVIKMSAKTKSIRVSPSAYIKLIKLKAKLTERDGKIWSFTDLIDELLRVYEQKQSIQL